MSNDEIRVLRKMIDAFTYERERGVFIGRIASRSRLVLATLAALTVLAVNVATLVEAAHHGSVKTVVYVSHGSGR